MQSFVEMWLFFKIKNAYFLRERKKFDFFFFFNATLKRSNADENSEPNDKGGSGKGGGGNGGPGGERAAEMDWEKMWRNVSISNKHLPEQKPRNLERVAGTWFRANAECKFYWRPNSFLERLKREFETFSPSSAVHDWVCARRMR